MRPFQVRVLPRCGRRPRHPWKITADRKVLDTFERKAQATAAARAKAKAYHAETGKTAQVVIHGLDGRFQREYTYGSDPARRPG